MKLLTRRQPLRNAPARAAELASGEDILPEAAPELAGAVLVGDGGFYARHTEQLLLPQPADDPEF